MESEGFTTTLKDLVVCVMSSWNREDFASGGFWVDHFVKMGSGKEFDMLSEGINMTYGITRVSILFFCFQERTLTAMLDLSDPDSKSITHAHANGHVGGTRTSTSSSSVIEPPLKRESPVTRNDIAESILCCGPAALDTDLVSPWRSQSSMVQ